jgi:hypothetical protein
VLPWFVDNEALLWWLAAASAVTFVATLAIVPMLLVRIPPDYFLGKPHRWIGEGRHPVVRAVWLIVRNLLGAVFIAAGILMLVLPGQGLLTILAGIMLLNFPGKWRLERWLVSHGAVLSAINWLRRRKGRYPLRVDGHNGTPDGADG